MELKSTKVYKVDKKNLDFINSFNQTTIETNYKSIVDSVLILDRKTLLVSINFYGSYGFMEHELEKNIEKLYKTKKGESICVNNQWYKYNGRKWVKQ